MSEEETWVPGNKSELMSAIEREWNLLMEVVSKLDEAKMTTPDEGGWSPKDNLAHLTEWMNVLMGYHLDRRPPHEVLGVSEDVTRDWDMEVINPALFERNKDRSTEDTLAELKRVYAELMKKLEATPFEDLLAPRHADDPQKRPMLLWVLGDTTDHFAEHRRTIEKMSR
ncbi:MAG: ClbS/DfsB family four-helix bundle protein [Anaerolineales bacterium]|nr:ClbS/DfsB family four-helix bundle protein [Anaerolineales bacterium]NUQ83655.1 ClbS/DfsB family four-helix bundle protein [Anaerolineales bacterium]